jgi:large subunit ribosomal protein L20
MKGKRRALARAIIRHGENARTIGVRARRRPQRRKRRAKILKLAMGYYGMKARSYRISRPQVEKSPKTAFKPQKDRKGDFQKLWIARINAAARLNGMSYRDLIAGLKAAGNLPDPRTLAELAVRDSARFTKLAKHAQAGLKRQIRDGKSS